MAVRQKIRDRFAELSTAQQEIGRFILDRPNDVLIASMRTVGQRSGAKPATLVRFAQRLGFAGWPELKEALASDMGLGTEPYGERARTLVGRAHDRNLVGELFKVHRVNLEMTEQQNPGSLERVCDVLERAPTVHAAGFRACYPIAFTFAYVYRLFRDTVQLVDGQGGTLEMQLRGMRKGDALVCISFAPYSREALQAAEAARESGCALIALTDSAASPLSLLANETILFATQSPSFFPSVASAMAITEGLLEILASRSGKAGVKRIDRSEMKLFESGAYLQAPRPRS